MATGLLRRQCIKDNVFRHIYTALRWIIEPSASMEEKQRRRAAWLSAFMLLVTISALMGAVVSKNAGDSSWFILLAIAAVHAIGYSLNRTGYYRQATASVVSIPGILILIMILSSSNEANIQNNILWLTLPLLISSLMLSLRHAIIVAVSYLLAIVLLVPLLDISSASLMQPLSFIFMIFFLVIAITAVRQYDQSEIEHQLTERQKGEQLQNDENYVLTLLGQGAELSELLDAIVHLGEYHDPSIKGSVLLFDSSRERLALASAPSLPDDYNELFEDGIPIGPSAGSCGTAAYLKERVIVTDIENSPLFKPLEEVVKRTTNNGLLSCWSQPIISSNGDLLGTIANYSNKVGEPDADNLRVLEWSARIAAIAIERKRAEQALRESEEKFSKAFRSSPLSISINTLEDDTIIECNESSHRISGYTREELIGRCAADLNMWVKAEERDRVFQTLREHGRVQNEEVHLRNKSGEIQIVQFSAEIISIGDKPCILSVINDITERKQAEEALANEAIRRRILVEQSRDGIVVLDQNGNVYESNQRFAEMLGYSLEEAYQLQVWDWEFQFTREQVQDMLRSVDETGDHFETQHRRKDGTIYDVEISTNAAVFAGEKLIFCVCRDITERKQHEEIIKKALSNLEHSSTQLAATNKELEAFSYSVSHDLRAPLRTIDGFSQALLEDYPDKLDEQGNDYLTRLRAASQKMGELIDGLLKLSRLTRSEMRKEKLDLSALAKEIAARLQQTQPERQAEFVIAKGLTTSGDHQLLRVLLENLLDNAWKFTGKRQQARIEFGATRNGGKKAYFIRDNGAGFDMTYANKLFGAFQRLHDTTEFPGTGIGLATVQRIIHRHGGSVWAEGTAGKGATFYFTLS